MLAWTFPADYFTKGIVFTDPQVQVQRQELLDLSSAMGGRNPEGLCPPSDLTRHKAERTVRRLMEEALRENLNQQNFLFVFFVEKKTIQFPFTKIFPSVITGIPPSRCPARTLTESTPP